MTSYGLPHGFLAPVFGPVSNRPSESRIPINKREQSGRPLYGNGYKPERLDPVLKKILIMEDNHPPGLSFKDLKDKKGFETKDVIFNSFHLDRPDMSEMDFRGSLFYDCVFRESNLEGAEFSISTGNKTLLDTRFIDPKNFDKAEIWFEGKKVVGFKVNESGYLVVADPGYKMTRQEMHATGRMTAANVMQELGYSLPSASSSARRSAGLAVPLPA